MCGHNILLLRLRNITISAATTYGIHKVRENTVSKLGALYRLFHLQKISFQDKPILVFFWPTRSKRKQNPQYNWYFSTSIRVEH